MKFKNFIQLISLTLAIVLLFQCLPLQAFAQTQAVELEETQENASHMDSPKSEYVSHVQSVDDFASELSILGEEESLRTEDTKHFRLSDGSFVAVSYGTAVHFQDETGAWQDIVNTPALTMDQSQSEIYRIINGETAILFAASTQAGNLFAVSSNDVSVSFSLPETPLEMTASTTTLHSAAEAEIISITEEETTQDLGQLCADHFMPEELRSQILYEEIYPGVDLKYTTYGYTVKEDIIVKSKQDSYRYEFLLNMKGLSAILEEGGSITLRDKTNNPVFRIPAPFMTDSNGALSEDVFYSLTEQGGDTILTVVADREWIEDESRVFPVIIDPTIYLESTLANTDITATYVEEGLPSTSHDSWQALYVGYSTYPSGNTVLGNHQIYMHINNLPQLPAGSTVAYANLKLYQYNDSYSSINLPQMNIGLYEVTSEKPTSYSSYSNWIRNMTWNTKALWDDNNMIDYTTLSSSTNSSSISLEVTELVSNWYEEGKSNRTFAIVPTEELSQTKCALTAFKAYGTTKPPVLMVFYRSNTGIEPYYTYQTMGVGNAGTAYIADATGQLKVVKGLVSYASTANPFALNLVYNSDYFNANENASDTIQQTHNLDMMFGKGFSWDVIQSVEDITISGQQYLLYHDGDGTDHYFYWDNEESVYCDEDGLGLTLIKGSATGSYTMSDKAGNTWTFTGGRLAEQTNRSGNKIIYTGSKNEDGYWLTQIKQKNSSGSEITLASISYVSGTSYVSSIVDAAGRVYSFGYDNGRLSTINLDGTLIAQYHYSGSRIIGMTDCESGYVLWFNWHNGKISEIKERIGVQNSNGTWNYPNSGATIRTKFTREKAEYRTSGPDNVMGNADDIISCFMLDYANHTVCAYTMDTEQEIYGATNAAYETTPGKVNNRTIRTASSGALYGDTLPEDSGGTQANRNLLTNGSFASNSSGWSFGANASYVTSEEDYAIQITPSPADDIAHDSEVSSAWQYVNVNQPGTQTYFLSGWAKGNAVPDNVSDANAVGGNDRNKSFGLRAILYYSNGEKEYHYVPFCTDLNDWQYTSMAIIPKKSELTVTKICIVLAYERNANSAVFDDIALVPEVAQTMKYDEDGNLISVTATGLDAENIAYHEGTNLIATYTGGSGTISYEYDTQGRVTSVTDGTVTQSLSYTADGNISGTTLSGGNLSLSTAAQYTTDGNRLYMLQDSNGSKVWYYYAGEMSQMMGAPTAVVTAKPGVLADQGVVDSDYVTHSSIYDGMGRVTQNSLSTYSSADKTGTSTLEKTAILDYNYSNGRLASITRSGSGLEAQRYSFSYDVWGNSTKVMVGERTLAEYSYSPIPNQLTQQTYGNGQYVSYTYDKWGRLKTATWSDGRELTYYYSNDSQISCIHDSQQECYFLYDYDALGRLITCKTVPANNSGNATVTSSYAYDTNNRLTGWQYTSPLSNTSETYTYDTNPDNNISDGLLTGMQMVNGQTIAYRYDELQRLTDRHINSGKAGGGMWERFIYADGSSRIEKKVNWIDETTVSHHFNYTYDVNGNILQIQETVSGTSVSYQYDIQGQLTKATHGDNRVESYSYDNAGNLLSFNNGTISHTYTYGDSNGWEDLLTAVDGQAITYDGIGNPTSYYNGYRYTMNWTEGRKLASLTYNGQTTSYQYDHNGIRTKKTKPDGSYTCYEMVAGKAVGETRYNAAGNVSLYMRYTFDESGNVVGISLWYPGDTVWTDYYFAKNLQGDVLAVYAASDNTCVAAYTYDSWGNILTQYGSLADINPFRYRGYYYDNETGLYYLQSRYYDPEMGRFINADVYPSTGQDLTGNNMFAYCGNNPVDRRDNYGTVWETVFDVLSLGASIVEVAVNPADPWAWAGLVGDAIDLIPFVTGVGEITRAVKVTAEVVEQVDNVIDATKALKRSAEASSNLRKATGAYEILYSSGKNYVGKGGLERAIKSAMEHAKPNALNDMFGDTVVSISWKYAPDSTTAFIEEYALQTLRGVNNSTTYNIIWSPGKKLLMK